MEKASPVFGFYGIYLKKYIYIYLPGTNCASDLLS